MNFAAFVADLDHPEAARSLSLLARRRHTHGVHIDPIVPSGGPGRVLALVAKSRQSRVHEATPPALYGTTTLVRAFGQARDITQLFQGEEVDDRSK